MISEINVIEKHNKLYLIKRREKYVPDDLKESKPSWSVQNVEGANQHQKKELQKKVIVIVD